jgi:predicted nucleic acid-binding protein
MRSSAVFFAPRFLRIEIEKHKLEIARRSKAKSEDIDAILAVVYRRISWVDDQAILPHVATARKALAGIDPNDVPYLACALAVEADAIWSHDLDFDKQVLVPRVPHPEAEIPRRE